MSAVRNATVVLIYLFFPTGFSSFIKRPLVLFTPCCAVMMQTLATLTHRSEPTSLSSTCPSFPLSWRRCISSTTSLVSRTYMPPTNIVLANHLLRTLISFAKWICFQCYCTWECFSHSFADSSPARVRHASAHADDADPDSGNTINQSVAMAIAGSPLPHVKANPFALPTVVSDNGRGQAVPPGPTDWQVTDLPLCGRLLPRFDRWSHCPFCNSTQTHSKSICILPMLFLFSEVQLLFLACRWLSVLFLYNSL